MVHVRPERHRDLREPEKFTLYPQVPFRTYRNGFGNICTRLVAPPGRFSLWNRFVIADGGLAEHLPLGAAQHRVEELPDDVLVFLPASRFCDTDKLQPLAWSPFSKIEPGWPRVEAILRYTHERIAFGYEHARADRTAWDAHQEGRGVCRDFAHLAIALCRCMNIPARYWTGYLGDIGVPIDPNPMDFSAWLDVYLGGAWHVVDARHNHPRIRRIAIACGRDAVDAAISTAFGTANLVEFSVITQEVAGL